MADIVHIGRAESPEQRAYDWANREMAKLFAKPDHFNIGSLKERCQKYDSHISFFESERPDEPAIVRVYWPNEGLVKYSVVENYNALKKDEPELVSYYLRNGLYAHELHVNFARKSATIIPFERA